jgi:hypothetical protein
MKVFEFLAATRCNQAGHSEAKRKQLKEIRERVLAKAGVSIDYLKLCKHRGTMGEKTIQALEEASKGEGKFAIKQSGRDLF